VKIIYLQNEKKSKCNRNFFISANFFSLAVLSACSIIASGDVTAFIPQQQQQQQLVENNKFLKLMMIDEKMKLGKVKI